MSGIGGGHNGIRLHTADCSRICAEVVAKGDQLFSKGRQLVIPLEPGHKTSLIGETFGKSSQRSGCGNGCLDHIGWQPRDAVGVCHHGRTESVQLISEGAKSVITHPFSQNTAAVGKTICHLGQGLRGICRVLHDRGLQPGHAVGIAFQRGPEQSQFLSEGTEGVVTHQICKHTALIGDSCSELCKGFCRICRSGHGLGVDPLDGLSVF